MNALIPNRFLFSFEFPLAYRKSMPKIDGSLRDWNESELLPRLGSIDGRTDFGEVWACWSESGLAIACRVRGKRRPLICDPRNYWKGDNLRLCTDMRDARNVHRATRFCQQFFFLPTAGGSSGKEPVAGVGRFQRAREEPPPVSLKKIAIASQFTRSGYEMEAFVPAECLVGFDPLEHARIGFYYILEDADHGQQFLTIGDDLAWNVDPSTWATAVLRRD